MLNVDQSLQEAVNFVASNVEIFAVLVAVTSAFIVYGVLGRRFLGAEADFWETLRATTITYLSKFAKRSSLYVSTQTTMAEYAGETEMSEDSFERALQEAGFLRQPLASLHRNERNWSEDGSWAKPRGFIIPFRRLADSIPICGSIMRRLVTSLDSILAMRQTHVIFYTRRDSDRCIIYVYAHDEPNPMNPLTAASHYAGNGFKPAPEMARKELQAVGVRLER